MEKAFLYEGALEAVRIFSGGYARGLSAHQRPLYRSVLPVRSSKVVRCSTKSPSCLPSHLKLVPAQAGILTASWLSTSPDALGLGGDWKMVKRTRELGRYGKNNYSVCTVWGYGSMGVWEGKESSHTPILPHTHTEKDDYFSGMALVKWCAANPIFHIPYPQSHIPIPISYR